LRVARGPPRDLGGFDDGRGGCDVPGAEVVDAVGVADDRRVFSAHVARTRVEKARRKVTTKKEGDTVLNSSCNNMRFLLSIDPLD
jgi:hypothetical protein